MSEPIYEFVPGQGWVINTPGRVITWSDFMTYAYDKWICVFCNKDAPAHLHGDLGMSCHNGRLGSFYPPR